LRTVLLVGWFGAVTSFGGNARGDQQPIDSTSSGTTTSTATESTTGSDTTPATWRENKLVLTVDPSYLALPYAREALAGAVQAWLTAVSELPEVEIVESATDSTTLSAAENELDHRISFAPDGEPRANGALAITLLTVNDDGKSVLDADIIIDGKHCFTDVTTYPESVRLNRGNIYDLQNVITHELGHWFGLGENYVNTEATMYAYVDPFETKKRDLTTSDIEATQLAYWHADNPSENTGCAIHPHALPSKTTTLGFLAVAGLLLRRSNRRNGAQLSS
jgi:hypothetical protein